MMWLGVVLIVAAVSYVVGVSWSLLREERRRCERREDMTERRAAPPEVET